MTQILHVADLHLDHGWFDWVANHCTTCELLVIAGDLQNAFSNVPMHQQVRVIRDWLLSLRVPTLVCSGNHDTWVAPRGVTDVYAEAAWLRMLRGKGSIVGVDGDVVEFSGLWFAVNGWLQIPSLDRPVFALVSHAAPSGCACAASVEGGADVGDPEVWTSIRDCPPTLFLAGHVHQPRRLFDFWPPIDPVTLILVPGCDANSEVPTHWVIDTETRQATHSSGQSVSWRPKARNGALDNLWKRIADAGLDDASFTGDST